MILDFHSTSNSSCSASDSDPAFAPKTPRQFEEGFFVNHLPDLVHVNFI